jgi:hypothetical protein
MNAIQRHAWAVACAAILFISQTPKKAQAFQISQTTRKFQLLSRTECRKNHQIPSSTILQLVPEEKENESQPTQSFDNWASLQTLAVAVSLFFVGTVFLFGDQLLPSPTASSSEPRQILNPDTVLREDFTRYETF